MSFNVLDWLVPPFVDFETLSMCFLFFRLAVVGFLCMAVACNVSLVSCLHVLKRLVQTSAQFNVGLVYLLPHSSAKRWKRKEKLCRDCSLSSRFFPTLLAIPWTCMSVVFLCRDSLPSQRYHAWRLRGFPPSWLFNLTCTTVPCSICHRCSSGETPTSITLPHVCFCYHWAHPPTAAPGCFLQLQRSDVAAPR